MSQRWESDGTHMRQGKMLKMKVRDSRVCAGHCGGSHRAGGRGTGAERDEAGEVDRCWLEWALFPENRTEVVSAKHT